MFYCPHCHHRLRVLREEAEARCPRCREPLHERLQDPRKSGHATGGSCAAHPKNEAVGTCQRCGNYACAVCRTRWQGRPLCAACVERSLESGERAPGERRTHFGEALTALLCGLASWGLLLLAILLASLGVEAAGAEGPGYGLVVVGGLLMLASPLPALVGVGQGAAAIRARGNHLILATFGLLLSGFQLGCVVGLFGMAVWQNG